MPWPLRSGHGMACPYGRACLLATYRLHLEEFVPLLAPNFRLLFDTL